MDEAIEVETIPVGIVDGLQTWEVIDVESGETIGWNQTVEILDSGPTPLDSALEKLTALGLTPEEAQAIAGV